MKKKPTVEELQAILDSPEGTYEKFTKKDGSLSTRKVRKNKKSGLCVSSEGFQLWLKRIIKCYTSQRVDTLREVIIKCDFTEKDIVHVKTKHNLNKPICDDLPDGCRWDICFGCNGHHVREVTDDVPVKGEYGIKVNGEWISLANLSSDINDLRKLVKDHNIKKD